MAESKKFEWALPLGTILNGGSFPYEVVEYLGQGGFGITYKVKARVYINNIGLDAFFAVKEYFPMGCWRGDSSTQVLCSRSLEEDMKAGLSDFITEGERLQKICKLNTTIVKVNEVFRANGTAYYVMEYLDGGDLRALVKENGRVSEAKMMSIMRPVAEAVQCLHENQMLHLDIKPENIVMRRSPEGRPDEPVLIDFGIAVHFDSKGNPTTKNPSTGVSAGYSPKEQYAGIKMFDPRIDIYALSATCFYLLTGKDPIDALNMPPGFVRQELPEDLSEPTTNAISCGMSLDKNDRQRSVSKFLHDFEAQHSLPVGAVITGQLSYYMISEVDVEKDDYIHYYATPWTGDPTSADNGTHRTSNMIYEVWEWWLPSFKREGQEVNTGGMAKPQDWWIAQKVGLSRPGTYTIEEDGTQQAEFVEQNNTLYCIVRKEPFTRKEVRRIKKGIKKPLLIALITLVAAGLIGAIGLFVAKSLGKKSSGDNSASIEMASSATESSSAELDEAAKYQTVENEEIKISLGNIVYSGSVDEKGSPNGKGKCTFTDGSTYTGDFVHGALTGEGIYEYQNGDIFMGTFENDQQIKGKYYQKDQHRYFEGSFKDDVPDPDNGTYYNVSEVKIVNGEWVAR